MYTVLEPVVVHNYIWWRRWWWWIWSKNSVSTERSFFCRNSSTARVSVSNEILVGGARWGDGRARGSGLMKSQQKKQHNKKGFRERADLQEGMWIPRGNLFALPPFPSMAPLTFSVDSLSIYTYLCICFHIPILYAHHESPWARQTEKLRHLSTWIISCTIHWNIMREQADAQSWQRYCRFATVTVDWWHLISSTWPIRSDQIISLSRGLCFLHYLCQDGVPACYGFLSPIRFDILSHLYTEQISWFDMCKSTKNGIL